jgi:hypothetical protein
VTEEPLSPGERQIEEALLAEGAYLREQDACRDLQEEERYWQALLARARRRTDERETLVSALEAVLRRNAELPAAPDGLSLQEETLWAVRHVVGRSRVILPSADGAYERRVLLGIADMEAFLRYTAGEE